MKRLFFLITCLAGALAMGLSPALANSRYSERPPVRVSPDLAAPWLLQLGHSPNKVQRAAPAQKRAQKPVARQRAVQARPARTQQTQATAPVQKKQVSQKRTKRPQINPAYLPQIVNYGSKHKPGTVVIDTRDNFLYLVEKNGKARRYGVGTGKPGFEWAGTHKVTRKAEWPDWRPPAQMIAREKAKGRHLPNFVAGGIENPLGARALYLGSTLYRIHGTNQPWTIGAAVSSGCIRMRNEDVVDLYGRVPVGATVIVM
ncbi:L,D-transpeptidase family protein [Aquamicrobium segne]|uniref:L,D-transpeptidase family protein n=1 Tax=Aquamicrobium segne TaxID=469547 RepID=A0ABW0GYA1_9HYPH